MTWIKARAFNDRPILLNLDRAIIIRPYTGLDGEAMLDIYWSEADWERVKVEGLHPVRETFLVEHLIHLGDKESTP